MNLMDRILTDNLTLGLSLAVVILFILFVGFVFAYRVASRHSETWHQQAVENSREYRELARDYNKVNKEYAELKASYEVSTEFKESAQELVELYKNLERT